MIDLTGKKAVVTGASRGIGRATARLLARQGARVVLTYVRGAEAAQQAVAEIVREGGTASAAQLDVSDFASAERTLSALVSELQGLDILVANAGIAIDALLLRLKQEDLESTLNVNVNGVLACVRAGLKPMLRARAGRIVIVSSVVGQMGNAGQVAYSASKAALFGVTKSLAREYASRGITINAVAPGYVETDMTQGLSEEQRTALLATVPLGRTAQPEEIAAAIAFLASPEAGYITGQILAPNGGMYM
jgi:3-oxoacyl-[acyl-carrier protein] reductase